MTFATYAAGVVVLAVIVVSLADAARVVAKTLAPTWPAPLRALAATVTAIAGIVAVAQLLGSVGLFSRVALAIGAAVASVVMARVARRFRTEVTDGPDDAEARPEPSVAGRLGLVAGSVLVAQWAWTAREAFRFGIVDVDSQSYHLSHAARFMQEHNTTSLHYIGAGDGAAYHPATAEMLHGIGMAALHSDVLSIVFNLAFLFVALLAAYCIGRRFGTGPASLIGFAVLAAAPLVAKAAAASAGNDYVAIAFFLAAVAFVLHADQQHRGFALFLAGLAGGLALGTKLTMVVPVLGLTLTVAWIARRESRRLFGFVVALILTGSYWYLRNLVHVGNPVPSLDVGFLPSPPMPLVRLLGDSVADYLGDGHFWRAVVPDALRTFFGVAWPALLAAAGIGIAGAFVSRRHRAASTRPVVVGLVVTAAATLAVYVVTPTSAGGANGNPFLFVYNLRYALPGLVVGLVLLPAVDGLQKRQAAVAAGGVALLLATATSDDALPLGALVFAVVLIAAGALAAMLPRRAVTTALVGLGVVALLAGLPAARRYQENRFATAETPRAALLRWGRSAPPGGRVALVGNALQYAFYGPHLRTTVDYVAERRASHEYGNYRTCAGLRTALRDGNYDYLVVEYPAVATYAKRAARWMRADKANEVVFENTAGVVFKLNRPPDPALCGNEFE